MAYEGHLKRGTTGHLIRISAGDNIGHLKIASPVYSTAATIHKAYKENFRYVTSWVSDEAYNGEEFSAIASAVSGIANGTPPNSFTDPNNRSWTPWHTGNLGATLFSAALSSIMLPNYVFGYCEMSGVKLQVTETNGIFGSPVLSSLNVSITNGNTSYFRLEIGTSATDPGDVLDWPSNVHSSTANAALTDIALSQWLTIRISIIGTQTTGTPTDYNPYGTYTLGTITESA